jgi:hypothetical protein
MMNHAKAPDFDDDNFLQSWLERRYGCGFAQMVLDDLAEQETLPEITTTPYMMPENGASNDNMYPLDTRKIS